jgi:acyl-coenzyme A synthetase/AMP-(fatty) acid ligase/acyl carrier protein
MDSVSERSGRRAAQEALRASCMHPSGVFDSFPEDGIEQSVAARFAQIARRYPERLAVKTGTHKYTYGRLNRAANRIAHAILDLNIEPGRPVGLLFDQGAPFIASSLGLLKAGRIQVPLDRWFPKARLQYMIEQSGAAVILADNENVALARELSDREKNSKAHRRAAERAEESFFKNTDFQTCYPLRSLRTPRLGGEVFAFFLGTGSVAVFDFETMLLERSDENPEIAISPGSPATVDYTSGSTGRPKGTVKSHRSLLHAVKQVTNAFHICPHDRLLMCRPAVRAYLYALLNGAAYYPFEVRDADLMQLSSLMIRERVTLYRSAVTTFRSWIETLTGSESFPDLRLISLYGEPVYHADVCRYQKHFAGECALSTSLGCSEFGDYAYFFVNHDNTGPTGVLPGGYPIPGTEILILNENGEPAPTGGIGEIAVRSRYGALGYWQEPELTRKAFHIDKDDGDLVTYRTGDIGRVDPDGCLFHSGRKDRQIKILGNRVDIGEVEAMLLEIPEVKRCTVVGREDKAGELRLVAYLVPAGATLPGVSELRRHMAGRLPPYLGPSAYVWMDELPLTDTGKVDAGALPDPEHARSVLESRFVAPRTALEEKIAGIWAELLGVRVVGADDSFLELGGNSMLATRFIVRLRDELAIDLPVRALFDAPTVAEIARLIEPQRS